MFDSRPSRRAAGDYVSKRTRKTSPRTVCSMSQQNKPKREVWFEPRRNHSAEGFRCILPVLTAEREREGVCDVLNEPRRNHSAEGLRCILPVLTAEREREGVCNVLNEPRHNHSAAGFRCILPVLTAEGERERARMVCSMSGRINPSARFGLSHAAIIPPKVSAVFCLY